MSSRENDTHRLICVGITDTAANSPPGNESRKIGGKQERSSNRSPQNERKPKEGHRKGGAKDQG